MTAYKQRRKFYNTGHWKSEPLVRGSADRPVKLCETLSFSVVTEAWELWDFLCFTLVIS